MAKPKPKGWSAMSKTQQEKWKKDNFSSLVKVTAADLAKLRAEKTPEKAIAKYKNDPKMREALNRFYGKARVGQVTASSSSSTTVRGGPGAKMPKRPAGGPGARTGRDGRVVVKTSSTKPSPTPSSANRPGPTATNRPGPSATNRPGPSATNRPGPSASNRPGPSASNRPGPSASNRPGPKPSDRPGPKRGSQ